MTVQTIQRLALLDKVEVRKPGFDEVEIYKGYPGNWITQGKMTQILHGLSGLLSVDIETNSTNCTSTPSDIVGIGLADSKRALYIDRAGCHKLAWSFLLQWIHTNNNWLFGHNIFFDAAFLTRDAKTWGNWKYCTYGLYRQLAGEGYQGQKWSLKNAQVELLGWADTNEAELDNWLMNNGHFRGPIVKDYTKDDMRRAWDKGQIKPDKSKMYLAPADILGYYCALDARSTYDLLTQVLLPAVNKLNKVAKNQFLNYHRKTFVTNVQLLVEQQLHGISVDRDKLLAHEASLKTEIQTAEQKFLNHEDVRGHIEYYNQMTIAAHVEKEPAKYKKPPKLGAEPPKFKKDGKVSKNWENWKKKKDKIDQEYPVLSKNWENWHVNYLELKNGQHFNLNSGPQKQWLFYERMGYPVLLRTETDKPAVDNKALIGFGDAGRLLKENNDRVKEHGYVTSCIEHLEHHDDGYRIHPQFRVPGTLTCRLAGSGGLNFQQLPKSRRYLECYRPLPGRVWIDCDIDSLEQVVLAEDSRDATLWKLYGPEAKKNDVYLFNGAYLPGIKDAILGAGYDPDNPTPEGIAAAKKQAKKARSVAKVITLGSSYGMGPNKLQMTLALQGIDIDLDEAKRMHRSYWELYSGVKEYERNLVESWKYHGGWIYNALGRPVCVAHDYIKDIVNRSIQSAGHDICMMIIEELKYLREESGLWYRGVCWDFHDQTIVECREEDAENVMRVFKVAYQRVNEKLNGDIPITGTPVKVYNLADAKLEG